MLVQDPRVDAAIEDATAKLRDAGQPVFLENIHATLEMQCEVLRQTDPPSVDPSAERMAVLLAIYRVRLELGHYTQ